MEIQGEAGGNKCKARVLVAYPAPQAPERSRNPEKSKASHQLQPTSNNDESQRPPESPQRTRAISKELEH